jgi:tRNA dimethylallyltransferase
MAGNAKMTVSPPLLAIFGPTASGKSSLAIALARWCGAEILSVDSMQVYQGMDIGTAKASLAERHEIRHHLLDWVRPDETFSVARFVELADGVIADAKRRGAGLIVTGGTPMYFKALFQGLFEGPAASESVRHRLREQTDGQLYERLQEVDAAAAKRIAGTDRRRMIRALEVFELSGRPISSLQQQWAASHPPRHAAVWIGLSWDREALNRRINARVKDMMSAGWLGEVAELVGRFELSKTAAEATGYRELIAHLRGEMTVEDAVEQIKIATRQLARRQMKWFRRFEGAHWIEGEQPLEKIVAESVRLWEQGTSRAAV